MINKPKRHETHKKAVEYAACNLIENGVTTKSINTRGVDLVLDNGKTISVRGLGEEIASPLMNGSLDTLKADFIVITTNMNYNCIRRISIMDINDAKRIAHNNPYKVNGRCSWFIDPKDYHQYRDNHSILMD